MMFVKSKLRSFVIGCLILQTSNANSQKNGYEKLKDLVVSIGFVDRQQHKYFVDGSGLMTYLKVGTNLYRCIITAKHIVDTLKKYNLDCYIRPSWADSIKTTRYFGMKVQLKASGNFIDLFTPKDSTIDLALILYDYDSVASNYYDKTKDIPVVAHNDIKNPQLGQNTLIYGYPSHVENPFNSIDYSVCTLKNGIVSWVTSFKLDSTIDKFLLVEANASYGNSGGPVFNQGGQLIGIQIGIYNDDPTLLMLNGNVLVDSTKHPYYITSRSGVCLILKAEIIRDFIDEVARLIAIK
jgi:Trypsin-like peptidase domain